MIKSELAAALAHKLKIGSGEAERVADCIFDVMLEALRRGEGIEIRGFGSFTVRNYKEYRGRNPRTGQTLQVQPKQGVTFKVGKVLRERVNEGRLKHPIVTDAKDMSGSGTNK